MIPCPELYLPQRDRVKPQASRLKPTSGGKKTGHARIGDWRFKIKKLCDRSGIDGL
ncbi:hypothetical protein QT970_09185 [Microcoleus sp. herbarium8]|uniref:hypothetical protein n=1 Tax=Microcoleus sp. herbarium8 TaxID=3055436 RepID=UPI002FCFD82D